MKLNILDVDTTLEVLEVIWKDVLRTRQCFDNIAYDKFSELNTQHFTTLDRVIIMEL